MPVARLVLAVRRRRLQGLPIRKRRAARPPAVAVAAPGHAPIGRPLPRTFVFLIGEPDERRGLNAALDEGVLLLLGVVSRLFADSVLGWYRRRLRTSPRELVQSGAVVVVQRASSDLKLKSSP